MKKHFLVLAALMMLIGMFATTASADQSGGGVGTTQTSQSGGGLKTTGTSTNQGLAIHLNNPLSGVSTIPEAINLILSIVIRIALPLIIIAFIWSGFKFITARGNPEDLKTAKNMFLYTVIGTLLILGAWAITNAIVGTVNTIIN